MRCLVGKRRSRRRGQRGAGLVEVHTLQGVGAVDVHTLQDGTVQVAAAAVDSQPVRIDSPALKRKMRQARK